jgi:8-oxo-dGTP pyrophosphatase MutT (NUDIX family)
MRYLSWLAGREEIEVFHTLERTLDAAIAGARPSLRSKGERYVPQHLWHSPSFQMWYNALLRAGNRLDRAELLWQYRASQSGQLFAWILKVDVWVSAEQRHKSNEWILARADVSATVLYRRALAVLDSDLVLIHEYRAPARTADGFVHELPGGSALGGTQDPRIVAASEVREETDLCIAVERLRPIGVRQVAATLSAHVAHVYAAEITDGELEQARAFSKAGTPHSAGGSERAVIEVTTVRALLADGRADWSTVGMTLAALLDSEIKG